MNINEHLDSLQIPSHITLFLPVVLAQGGKNPQKYLEASNSIAHDIRCSKDRVGKDNSNVDS